MARKPRRQEVTFLPGTHPAAKDSTQFKTVRCTDTDKVYFKTVDGEVYVRPLPFWAKQVLTNGIYGEISTAAWYRVNGAWRFVVGTSTGIYASSSTTPTIFVNITPILSTTTAIADSIATTNGSATITFTANSHGQSVGDRVTIAGAANTGGILAADINGTRVITARTANTFSVTAGTSASSTVASGGGAGTTYAKQASPGSGSYWSMASFGNVLVLTPGNGGKVYEWGGDITTPTYPTVITDAPTANYVFVSNNAVVVLGADGVENRIQTSEIGDHTSWAQGSAATGWQDDLEGYGRLIASAKSRDLNLVFTSNRVIALQYNGQAAGLWDWDDVMETDGLVSQRAVASINDVVYWMGHSDCYVYDGAPSPLKGNTCHDTMFIPTPPGQGFIRPVPQYEQVWFCTGTKAYIYDYAEKHMTACNYLMTAAENPYLGSVFGYPITLSGSSNSTAGALYYNGYSSGSGYEDDANDDNYIVTNFRQSTNADRQTEIHEVYLEFGGTTPGSVDLTTYFQDAAMNQDVDSGSKTLSDFNFGDGLPALPDVAGKFWAYKIQVNQGTPNGSWRLGRITEAIQEGVPL